MLQRDIERLSDPDFIPDSSNAVYITFLIIGIIGYFTIPTVSNWIVQAGGGAGNYLKNVNQRASQAGSPGGWYGRSSIEEYRDQLPTAASVRDCLSVCMHATCVFFRMEGLHFCGSATGEDLCSDEGKSLMLALSQDLEQNRPVEAREHVRRFHELFFTLSPDKSAIEGNIQRAMFLSDRSAYAHYVDLAEQGYYNRIISGNMSQRIGIDSVRCDFNTYPYEVVTYAKLSIIREKSVTERSLVTRGRLLNSTRSDNNPHGFILEAFRVVENRDIKVYDR